MKKMAQRRRDIGMTQATLAQLVSQRGPAFHQQTVQRIENGDRPVRLNEAVLIVQALGLATDGEFGLDAAVSPELFDELEVSRLLGEVLVLMDQTMSTAAKRVADAATWAGSALSQMQSTMAAYEDVLEQDTPMLIQARRNAEAYQRYLAELAAVCLEQPEGIFDGEHPEEA